MQKKRINKFNRKLIRENAMLVDQLRDEGINYEDFHEKPPRNDELISFNYQLNLCECIDEDNCPIVEEEGQLLNDIKNNELLE